MNKAEQSEKAGAEKPAEPATHRVNWIDVDAFNDLVDEIREDPEKGVVEFRVTSEWKGQTRSESKIDSFGIGGERVPRKFKMVVDEPFELLGENTAPNPQEYLMAALNACLLTGYVTACAKQGIRLEKLEVESTGQIDMRGFLGLDDATKPGYERLRYAVRLKGDASPEQLRKIHEAVAKSSPNVFNLAQPVAIDADLIIEE